MSALSIKCIFEAFDEAARQRRLGSGGLHLSSRPQQAGFQPTSNKNKRFPSFSAALSALRGGQTRLGARKECSNGFWSANRPEQRIETQTGYSQPVLKKLVSTIANIFFPSWALPKPSARGVFRDPCPKSTPRKVLCSVALGQQNLVNKRPQLCPRLP